MRILTILCFFILLAACGGKTGTTEQPKSDEMDQRDRIRLQQYMVAGKDLFSIYCVACHQSNGQGLASLYPPLAKSDYLMADLSRAACIIKNGMQNEITVNGTKYNQMMPANSQLTPLEIAEILTYVTNSWGNEAGIGSTNDVTAWLEKCGEQP